MREADIERRVVKYCQRESLLIYKWSSPAHRGVPDRIIVGRGKVMFLELKQAGKKPTALQLREIARIRDAGGWATWADNADDAIRMIRDFFWI